MTDYNDGKWHGWNGGECPVHICSVIECAYSDKRGVLAATAGGFPWNAPHRDRPVAFRVIKQHREPRELWMREIHDRKWTECGSVANGATLFREVLE